MNGSRSPDAVATDTGHSGKDEIHVATVNGHRSPSRSGDTGDKKLQSSPLRSQRDGDQRSPNTRSSRARGDSNVANGENNDADSEAETLIDSPVKKKEADRHKIAVRPERAAKHRIGSLPVPIDGDDDMDSAVPSPVPSTVMSVEKAASPDEVKGEDGDRMDADGDKDDNSDSLSSPRSSASNPPSRGSSVSRAASELPDFSRSGAHSPNPRKRKHRASSVSLPNKRRSMEPPKRKLRGLHSEEFAERNEKSLSPKLRSHRRAASTQSAFADGPGEIANRKRRAGTQGPGKETKIPRPGGEESDASSETTSQGQADHRRPQRGIGRSTSTPGRPSGREHKRHVNKYGFTRLAEACEAGDLELVKEWRDRDPDQLELAEYAGNKPLQIAALNGNVEVVEYLIDQGCQIDCANVDMDTPLIDAAENGHLDVVVSLLKAGVDPLRQNLKGQQALDVVTDDTDDADEIRAALRNAIEEWNTNGSKQRREEEEELRHRAGPTKELHFMARTYENLLRLVQINDRNGVKEFLDARVPVDNAVIAAAAKTGDLYLVNMLLADIPEKKAAQKPEKPMMSVLGTSHFEMVRSLSELENFNPLYRNRQGKSWPEIAEERHGPNWREEKELLEELYDRRAAIKERRSSSPVTKRDSGKRRMVRAPEDDSDEEEAPRRKNGRRLMSRRDMRAASGRASSGESSDESSSEVATAPERDEETMKPPQSPPKRTTTSRTRRSSFSVQPTDSSPRTRRRSSSLRGPGDQHLPTLDEKHEDKAAVEKREAEERRALEEAEAKRKAEEAAEAEAAAKRAAEEEVRRAEEERKAEASRRAEEERLRIEEEQAAAKRNHRERIFASLPSAISHALNPDSGFDYDGIGAIRFLLQYLAPLQVLKHENSDPYGGLEVAMDAPYWVPNVQAAPFIGPQGIELLLRPDIPGFKGSLADTWDTKDVADKDKAQFISAITNLPTYVSGQESITQDLYEDLNFTEEAQRSADKYNAFVNAKKALLEGAAVLRYVRLDDLLRNLHPIFAGVPIEVWFQYLPPTKRTMQPKAFGSGFGSGLAVAVQHKRRQVRYVDGQPIDGIHNSQVGATAVTIVHEK